MIGPSADGNIDDPQFQWLAGRARGRDARRRAGRPLQPPRDPEPDRERPRRVGAAVHRRRRARPRHQPRLRPRPADLGADPPRRRHGGAAPQYPHVIAWVAGHSHVNASSPTRTRAAAAASGAIRVAAEADWPQQSRLLEIFDNEDGTLSIFGTILDHAAEATAPASGTRGGRDERGRPGVDRAHASANDTAERRPPTARARRPTATSSC